MSGLGTILSTLGGGTDEDENVNALKKAGPAIIIFVVAVLVRGGLEFYQARHPAPTLVDFSWVTTFAAIAASWLGLGAGISNVLARLGKVEKNTNGKSDAERQDIARAAAAHALAAAQEVPVIVKAVSVPAVPAAPVQDLDGNVWPDGKVAAYPVPADPTSNPDT